MDAHPYLHGYILIWYQARTSRLSTSASDDEDEDEDEDYEESGKFFDSSL